MAQPAITLYGIANCDSVRKARKWLTEQGVDYRFHDFRKDGLNEQQLRAWSAELGWQALLNRRGTTWRKLPEALREAMDEEQALQVMLEQPAIIKRPLLDLGSERRLGFSDASYQELFA